MSALSRISAAYAAETFKALRQWQWYAGPGLVLAISAATFVMHGRSRNGLGYGFIADAVSLSVCSAGFLLVLLFSASLVAPEADSGVLRGVLVRPVHRRELLLAKWLLGCTYAAAITGTGAAAAWFLALSKGGLTGVTFGGELLFDKREMDMAFLGATAAVLAPMAAAVSFGLMFSVLARTPGGAYASVFAAWLTLDSIKYPLGIAQYVFSTHIETPWQVFRGRCADIDAAWFPELWYCFGASAVACIVCMAAAMWSFERRNFS